MGYQDRAHAGRVLAEELSRYSHRGDVVVLALPRGGVPVGFEVARALGAPLDVFVVRKLGVPGQEELAMGAIASGGVRVLNEEVLALAGVDRATLEYVTERERRELARREAVYRAGRPPAEVKDKVAIVVDDGLATGASMRAAVMALRNLGPARIVVAVPVAPPDTCLALEVLADEMVCPLKPEPFYAVGSWYDDFRQTTDDEVRALLEASARARETQPAARPEA